MPKLRLHVEIQKGVQGVPLTKVSSVVGEIQKFLSMLSEDLSFPAETESWVGTEFKDGSLQFIAEKPDIVTAANIVHFNDVFSRIAEQRDVPSVVRRSTMAQFAKIAHPIEQSETVGFSLFAPPLERRQGSTQILHGGGDIAALRFVGLTKQIAAEINTEVQAKIKAFGAVQGRIHSLFLASKPPYFQLRELSTGELVRCTYSADIYPAIAKALQHENAVLHVYGFTETDLVQRRLEEVSVSNIEMAPTLSSEDFESIFGAQPRFTGRLTTQEFMSHLRDRGKAT